MDPMLDEELITLQSGEWTAVIAPAIGGRLFSCTAEVGGQVRDLVLPVPRDLPIAQAIANAGSYPLVPFSNRIDQARFQHEGRSVTLSAHPLGAPHAIHGIGWVKPWSVIERNGRAASLRIEHEADEWPWAFAAEQTFSLDPSGLTVSMLVTNRSDSAMPCGMGFHPYFPRPEGTRLRARVRDHWLLRPDCIPCGSERAFGRFPFDGVTPLRTGLDDGFSGWDRRARLDYADYSIELTATPGLDRLVVYSPAQRPLVCVEPVSHVTNAMNLEAAARRQAGWRVIEPGASWLESMHLSVKPLRA